MENSKTIQIAEIKNLDSSKQCSTDFSNEKEEPLSYNQETALYRTSKVLRHIHVTIATLVAFAPPILVYFLFLTQPVMDFFNPLNAEIASNHSSSFSYLQTGIAITILLAGMVVSATKCNPVNSLVGICVSAIVFSLGNFVNLALAASFVVFMVSLILSNILYFILRDKHVKKLKIRKSKESLNPRCSTCYINKLCPMQPDGFLDQYTPVSDR